MHNEARIRALYSALVGKPYAQGESIASEDLYKSAEILFRFFSPTDEQIGALLFYTFAGTQPEQAVDTPTETGEVAPGPETLQASPYTPVTNGHLEQALKREAPSEKEKSPEIPILEAGAFPWTVEIDGIPVTWRLNYHQGKLPATKGKLVRYQDKLYRVAKVYGTALHLTSQESETYDVNLQELLA